MATAPTGPSVRPFSRRRRPVPSILFLLLCLRGSASDVGTCPPPEDTHAKCVKWAAKGECAANPRYMRAACPSACGVPGACAAIAAHDELTYVGDAMEDLCRWILMSGSRAAFVLLLGPACADGRRCAETEGQWRALAGGQRQRRDRGEPAVDMWTAHCEHPDPQGSLCHRALNAVPPRADAPLILEWTGDCNWEPVLPRDVSLPPVQVLRDRLRTALARGETDAFQKKKWGADNYDAQMGPVVSRSRADRRIPLPPDGGRGFVRPMYWSLGLNNYKMEFRRAVAIALVTNRTLCLTPMEDGRTYIGKDVSGEPTQLATLYDAARLDGLVPTAHPDACPPYHACVPSFALCGRPEATLYRDAVVTTEEYGRRAARYGGTACTAPLRCGVGPEVPVDVHWRIWRDGLRKPPGLVAAAREWTGALFGDDGPYVALHWRFEEDVCPREGHRTGECVWTMDGPVALPRELLLRSVRAAAAAAGGVRRVFIATDGRYREGDDLVDGLREDLGALGYQVRESRDADVMEGPPHGYGGTDRTFRSELEQQIVALSSFAIGSSRSSWYFEALFDMVARDDDRGAFEIVLEVEEALHAMSPELHKEKHVPFPSVSTMDGVKFGFLGEAVSCDYDKRGEEAVETDGSIGICCRVNC